MNSIDQLGNETTYVYDVLNRKTQTIDARGSIVTLTYDANNNLLGLTDPVGNQTQWQYDALNRQVQELDPLSFVSTSAYDAIDRQVWSTDRNGQRIAFSYDLLNRETGELWYSRTSAFSVNTLTFTYDPNNNLLTESWPGSGFFGSANTTTMTYDALDRLSTMQDSFGTLQTSAYDSANNRLMLQDSFGGAITRTYDALNRVTTMQFSGQSATLREDFGYSARDQVTGQTRYSNLAGTTTVGYSAMVYDGVGRMTNLQHLDGSSANIANYTNTYDLASRITAEILNGGAPTTYQYDVTSQLTNDTAVTYSYDLNGNRTMAGYTTGQANELTSDGTWSYFYDRNGNQVQKTNISTGEYFAFGYDVRNRLTTIQDATSSGLQMQATYVYDGLGKRIEKDVAIGGITTVTRMAYDDTRQIWVDMNGSNSLQMRYLRTEYVLELPARVSSGGTAAWLLSDRMGSIRNVVSNTGIIIATNTFDGFGNTLNQSNAANAGAYLWDGYRFDSETGVFRSDATTARYYSPSIGRFNSVDPIQFDAGDTNLWRYVRNNSSNSVDASGLQPAVPNPVPKCPYCGRPLLHNPNIPIDPTRIERDLGLQGNPRRVRPAAPAPVGGDSLECLAKCIEDNDPLDLVVAAAISQLSVGWWPKELYALLAEAAGDEKLARLIRTSKAMGGKVTTMPSGLSTLYKGVKPRNPQLFWKALKTSSKLAGPLTIAYGLALAAAETHCLSWCCAAFVLGIPYNKEDANFLDTLKEYYFK